MEQGRDGVMHYAGFSCTGSTRRRAYLQRVVVVDIGGGACVVAELGLVRQRLQVGEQDIHTLEYGLSLSKVRGK